MNKKSILTTDAIDQIKKTKQVDQVLKEVRLPHYIDIPISADKKTRVIRPKNIIRFKYKEDHFLVFGDDRCEPKFDRETLEKHYNERMIILMFKRTSSDGVAVPVSFGDIFNSRKRRLAVAISLKAQDNEKFLRDELNNHDESVSYEDLEIDFLSSLNDDLIIKDIKRIIQIYYQS